MKRLEKNIKMAELSLKKDNAFKQTIFNLKDSKVRSYLERTSGVDLAMYDALEFMKMIPKGVDILDAVTYRMKPYGDKWHAGAADGTHMPMKYFSDIHEWLDMGLEKLIDAIMDSVDRRKLAYEFRAL